MYAHKRKHLRSLLEKLSGVKTYGIHSAPKHLVPTPKISIIHDMLLVAQPRGQTNTEAEERRYSTHQQCLGWHPTLPPMLHLLSVSSKCSSPGSC